LRNCWLKKWSNSHREQQFDEVFSEVFSGMEIMAVEHRIKLSMFIYFKTTSKRVQSEIPRRSLWVAREVVDYHLMSRWLEGSAYGYEGKFRSLKFESAVVIGDRASLLARNSRSSKNFF
jgi:hypothetical protein